MAENERPLSDFITSVEQVDAPDVSEQDMGVESKQKKSKAFPIVVGILSVLILGMGGYYVYTQYFAQEEDVVVNEEESINEDVQQVEELVTEISIPDESNSSTEDTVFQLNIPDGWSVDDSVDYAAVITNGDFSISITKNPIVTGGGWGFMYEGVTPFETLVQSLTVNGEAVNKITHVLPTDVINDTELEDIFAGSVFASMDSNISTPTLELGGEKYLIKYMYDGDTDISVDSQEYIDAIGVMDSIVESISIK